MNNGNKKQAVHRPGPFKQPNKPHKQEGHKKKKDGGEKGRVGAKALTHSSRSSKLKNIRRKDRKNRALQIRRHKREEVLTKKRGLGGFHSPPVLVAIIPLSSDPDPLALLEKITECDEGLTISRSSKGYCHISCSRFKQRFTFIVPELWDIHAVLDAAKVVDCVLFVHSIEGTDEYTETLLSILLSHALPTTIHIVEGLEGLNPKKKSDVKKAILKSMESRFPDEKVHQADSKQDLLLVLRQLGSHKKRPIGFRDSRPHLLAENVEFESNEEIGDGTGTLKVSGYIRGKTLDVNSLVHIPGWGDYQMSQIDYITDPHPLCSRNNRVSLENLNEEMAFEETVIAERADPSVQESLQSELVPDPMDGEQTWPTEEELAKAESRYHHKKVVEGANAYQAAWIIDSNSENSSCSEEDEEEEEEEGGCNYESDCEQSQEDMEYEDEQESKTAVEDAVKYDDAFNEDEEKKTLVRFREERMEQLFPDEQDTPMDGPARIRYQRYRGLKSFAYSTWNVMENLPPDYARIYRFHNFRQTKKKALNAEKEGAVPGLYVTLHVRNVPSSLFDSVESSPLILYGLLVHEQKMSCINVVIKKHPSYTAPVKSKDKLIFHIGFRRFVCQPVFSVHNIGNKFKYERFLPNDCAVVASFYAPVTFPPASVVVFKQSPNGFQHLVATGNMFDVNPDRLIIKRIVLSGHPFKIYKRTVVVRYMFFNKEDIEWFKKIQIHTKSGRNGHIRESLGTHGHMKCMFDQQLKSDDIVLMSLYKRVFPKWTYDPFVPTPITQND